MMKVRKERELERLAFKIAKKECNEGEHGKDISRFNLLKLKKSILERLKNEHFKGNPSCDNY